MAAVATAPQPTTAEPEVAKKKPRPAARGRRGGCGSAVAAIVVFCLFPFYWLINISLKTGNDLSVVEPVPAESDAEELPERSSRTPTSRDALRNSAVVALSTTVLALTVGSFCAYALARLQLRGQVRDPRDRPDDLDVPADRHRRAAVQAVVGHRPLQHVDRPDHPVPDVRAAAERSTSSSSFFKEIPKDLEEAALVDGATHFEAFRKVVVPLAAPGLATAGDPDVHRGLERVPARGDADVLVEGPHRAGGDRVLHRARRSTRSPYGSIAAASVVISVPLILLVLLFQKRIVAGLTAGAVKG